MIKNVIIVLFISIFIPSLSFASQTPELIPRSVLFGNPEKAQPAISPDGTKLAYLAPDSNGVLNVWISDLDLSNPKLVTKAEGPGVRQYFWHYDSKHILYLKDFDGNENAHLYIADFESEQDLDLTPFDGVKVNVVAYRKEFPNTMLISMNLKKKEFFDIYRLNLTSGDIKFHSPCLANGKQAIVDKNLFVRGFIVAENHGGSSVYVRKSKNDRWARVLKVGVEDSVMGVGFSDDNAFLHLFTSVGRPTISFQKLDLRTKKLECLYQDENYDMRSAYFDPKTGKLLAIAIEKENLEWMLIEKTFEKTLKEIQSIPNSQVDILDADLNDDYILVSVDQKGQVPKFYLYDRTKNGMTFLFSPRPELSSYELAETEGISFTARDGMKLYGYITMPKTSNKSNLPCVVMVHGGPWTRDLSRHSGAVQWLANRGYVVLQVNFRGSTGYGKEYFLAGKKEWGAKMQDDIIDAKNYLVSLNLIDSEKVAIDGGSYGGYAALCGLAFTPEEFACGVDVVGPSNLVTLMENVPSWWVSFRSFHSYFIGDVLTEKDFLESRSPLFKADQITKPLLIAQGANDPRVSKQESDQIVERMKDNNKSVEYLLFENEGHNFQRPETRLTFYEKAEQFLAAHLGGRAET